MKSKKLTNLKLKFIKLELIKLKAINNFSKVSSMKQEIVEFILFLRKAFAIVYKYHINKKKILFVDVSQRSQNKIKFLLKLTKHYLLTKNYNNKGFLTNKFKTINNYNKNSNNNSFLIKKSFDLIIILNPKQQTILIKDALKLKIPTITFKYHTEITNNNIYNIPCELLRFELIKKRFFLLLIKSTLKRFNI